MLSESVVVVDIGPRWMLEPKRLALEQARFAAEVREPVPGFIALYIDASGEERYRQLRPLD